MMKSFFRQENSRLSKKIKGPLVLLTAGALAALLLLTAASGGAMAATGEMPAKKTLAATYNTEVAEFLYLSGDYLGANFAARKALALKKDYPERNRAAAIKLLSDLKLVRVEAEETRSMEGVPFETFGWILDELLKRGEYKKLQSISSESKDPYAAYYNALTLYAKGRYDEAESKLKTIQKSSPVYPYAITLTAQIKSIGRRYTDALKLLKEAETRLKEQKSGFINAVRLLKGYALYEIMDYNEATKAFLSVNAKNRLYKTAVTGAIWSHIRTSRYKNALSLLDRLRPLNPYSIEGRELLLAEAYCHYALGNDKKALYIASNTLNIIHTLTAAYDKIAENGALPEGITSLNMLTLSSDSSTNLNESTPDDLVIIESLRLASAVKDKLELDYASNYYKAYERLKTAFDNQELNIKLTMDAVNRNMLEREAWLKDLKTKSTSSIKELLVKIKIQALEKNANTGGYKIRHHSYPAIDEIDIIERWEQMLHRTLTPGEKDFIRLALLDGEAGFWYLNNTQYAQFLFWMAIDPERKEKILKEGIFDRMMRGIITYATTGEVPFENSVPILDKKIADARKSDEALLATLSALKGLSFEGSLESEKAKDKAKSLLEATLIRRARLLRYEIRLANEKHTALIKMIKGAEGGM